MSPSACSNAFNATTEINIIDPENITLVYSRPNKITSLLEPISKKKVFENFKPK